jgi:hypothetical protein
MIQLTLQTDMTKILFEMAKMMGKEAKLGDLNPQLRQGLGVGMSCSQWI